MALNTPKRIKIFKTIFNSPSSDCGVVWRDCDTDRNGVAGQTSFLSSSFCSIDSAGSAVASSMAGSLSPASSCDSPEANTSRQSMSNISGSGNSNLDGRENRRGRPRSEALTTLMIEGSTSPSAIKCTYCNRVFPREKSLQAHLRTHTGERPYLCDFPGCTRAFTQSGQLKTHQRLHTGERPFMCSAPSCQMRFTHANRHCPEHPYDQLKRCDDFVIQSITEQNQEVIKWLEKYKMEKEDRTPTRKTPKRVKSAHLDAENMKSKSNENYNGNTDEENTTQYPVTPNNPFKSRKGLMVELDMNAGLGLSPIAGTKIKPTPKIIRWQEPLSQEEDSADEFDASAKTSFNPKKRWIREAWQDDLAKPLDQAGAQSPLKPAGPRSHSIMAHPSSNQGRTEQPVVLNLNPNQMRPTVLMVASKDRAMPMIGLQSGKVEIREFEKSKMQTNELQPHNATSPTTNHTRTNDPTLCDHNNTENTSIVKNRKWLGALALMQLATDDNITNDPQSSVPAAHGDRDELSVTTYTEL